MDRAQSMCGPEQGSGQALTVREKEKKNGYIWLYCVIIYTKKFLDCDWLREMQFLGDTVQKKGN